MDKILLVEDTDSLRDVLCQVLEAESYAVSQAASAEEALKLVEDNDFTMILSDLKLPGMDGVDFIKKTREHDSSVPVVVMTAFGSIEIAVDAMKVGATDFITKPFEPQALCNLVSQVIEHRRIVDRSANSLDKPFLTQNPETDELLEQARRVAPLNSPVLVLGESGTGKELIARFIHENSTRASEAFVAVNCGSMPSDLLESEFFGHEAGAFTGASEQRVGLFEIASSGTIFLDEIGNMPATLQAKLLRALQESEIKRLGSTKFKKINTRVISATNCDIDSEIRDGKFREDLYYRLGVVVLEVPPLRKRPEDIPLLTQYFLKTISAEFERDVPKVTSQAMKHLETYQWPGNVRELENAISRALIMHKGPLEPEHFDLKGTSFFGLDTELIGKTLPEIVQDTVKRTEKEIISKVLAQTMGNKSQAAEILGVSYKTLLNKAKEYKLDPSKAQPEPKPE